MDRTRIRETRSKKALVWAAFGFLGIQVAIGLVLQNGWPLVRFPSAKTMLANLDGQPHSPTVLMLGSSRSGCAIDGRTINGLLRSGAGDSQDLHVFNAAVPVGDPIASEFLLGLILQRGIRPDHVFLEISPENLNDPNIWMVGHATRQLGWKDFPGYFLESIRSNTVWRYLGTLLLPGHFHRNEIRDEIWEAITRMGSRDLPAKEAEAVQPIAWDQVLAVRATQDREELRRRLQDGPGAARRWLKNYRIRGKSKEAVERILATCRREKIHVVLWMPPLAEGFRSEYKPEIQAVYQDYVETLCRRFECDYVDGRDWLDDSHFRDAGHVDMPEGTRHFCQLLTQRVLLKLNSSRTARR